MLLLKKDLFKRLSTIIFTIIYILFLLPGDFYASAKIISSPLVIKSTEPVNGSKNVSLNKGIKIIFNQDIREGSEIGSIKIHKTGTLGEIPVMSTVNRDTLIITPYFGLDNNTSYIVYLPYDAVRSIDGFYRVSQFTFGFETEKENTPPKITYSNPTGDSRYVPINTQIILYFSEKVQFTGSNNSIALKDSKNNIDIVTSISDNVMIIDLNKGLNLAYDTVYTLNIPSGAIKDMSGNSMENNYSLKFKTESWGTKPKLTYMNPMDGSKDVSVGNNLTLSFNENIKKGKSFEDITLKNKDGKDVEYEALLSGNRLIINPDYNLEYDTEYKLLVPHGAICGISGSVSKDDYEIAFKTSIEKFPPVIIRTFPSNGADNAAVDSTIGIVFDEKVQKGDNFENIILRDSMYNYVPVTCSIKDELLMIKLNNSLNMGYSTYYTLFIPYGGVKDMAGNSFSQFYTLNFKTGYERFSPIIKYTEPENDSKDVSIEKSFIAVFNDEIRKGDNFEDIILESDGKKIEAKAYINGDRIEIKPLKQLEYDKSYKITIPICSIKDRYGNYLKDEFIYQFKTSKEKIAPHIEKITPSPDTFNVDIKEPIVFTFDEGIKEGKDFDKISIIDGVGDNIQYSAAIKENAITLTPKNPLKYGTAYSVRIPKEAIYDMNDNVLNNEIYTYFLTKGEEVKEPPKPVEDKNLIQVKKVILSKDYKMAAVYFSENIAAGKEIKKVVVKDSSGKAIGFPYSIKNNMIIIRFKTQMVKNKDYSLFIPKGSVKGKSSGKMNSEYTQILKRK